MEITCQNNKQLQYIQYLLRYDFKIDYCPEKKNLDNVFSPLFKVKNVKKELVERNRKILNKLPHFLSKNNDFLRKIICYKVKYVW